MFKSLSQIFKNGSSSDAAAGDDQHRLRVATCVLLLEAAYADDDFSTEERQNIESMVGVRFGLDASETQELLELAEKERSGGGDLYQFARLVSESYPRARRLAILELLWEVVYSDGVLEAHEDALMHKLGTLLGARHEELMAVKVSVRKKLGLS
jgi:uncharacterized tellurite resistance protein B-like protein